MELSKNCLSVRVQKFITGHKFTPTLTNNLCVHFWETVFCVMLSPFYLIIRCFIKISDWNYKRVRDKEKRILEIGRRMTLKEIIKIRGKRDDRSILLIRGWLSCSNNRLNHLYSDNGDSRFVDDFYWPSRIDIFLSYIRIPFIVFSVVLPVCFIPYVFVYGISSFLLWLLGSVFWAVLANKLFFAIENRYYELRDDVFFSYIKSFKKRICPMIEWVE